MAARPLLGLSEGSPVEVWSNSAKAWLEGRVEQVFDKAGIVDGFSVPAGCIKVSSAAGIRYVMPGQAGQFLKLTSDSLRLSLNAKRPRPTERANAGTGRVEARDRWNTYEIRLQEVFMEYDRDKSGSLEVEEFQELLRDFNDGKQATTDEYDFIMRLCDKDHDNKISLGELHYALRAWYSYRHLDGCALRLFAEFETGASSQLDPEGLQSLLTAMNGGKLVAMEEVVHVMEQVGVAVDGTISRSELLVAVACWYMHVDRRQTDALSLLREAAARTAAQRRERAGGVRSLGQAVSVARGYDPLQSSEAAAAAGGSLSSSLHVVPSMQVEGDDLADRPLPVRLSKAAPLCLRSVTSLFHATSPFVLGSAMVLGGWSHRVNDCPRNLDGILLWFGLLVLAFSSLGFVQTPNVSAERARLAISVMLAGLSTLGLLWTLDVYARDHEEICGHSLVWWSRLAWVSISLCACGYGLLQLAVHLKKLRSNDQQVQHEITL